MDEGTGLEVPRSIPLSNIFLQKSQARGDQVTKSRHLDHMRPLNCFRLIPILLCGLVVAVGGQSPILAAKREPPIRTGLWVIQPLAEDSSNLSDFAADVRANPQLTGVGIHFHWKDVEKEAGKPDFSAIDKTVSVLRGIGMKYQLCLQPGVNTRLLSMKRARSLLRHA